MAYTDLNGKLKGADIHAKGSNGATPMFSAAHEGQLDVMKWLKEEGADNVMESLAYSFTIPRPIPSVKKGALPSPLDEWGRVDRLLQYRAYLNRRVEV